jgi:hypothetical protein
MIDLTRLCLTLAFVCLPCTALKAQDLPSNWSATYVAHEWQGICEVVGRGGCREGNTYYYDSNKGILVRFINYDQRVIRLLVTSTKNSCAAGSLSIDGARTLELAGNNGHCGVAGGKHFREAESITNSYSQLDIGMFRKAKTITIDIQLSNGDKLNAKIPMRGFGEKLEAARKADP